MDVIIVQYYARPKTKTRESTSIRNQARHDHSSEKQLSSHEQKAHIKHNLYDGAGTKTFEWSVKTVGQKGVEGGKAASRTLEIIV